MEDTLYFLHASNDKLTASDVSTKFQKYFHGLLSDGFRADVKSYNRAEILGDTESDLKLNDIDALRVQCTNSKAEVLLAKFTIKCSHGNLEDCLWFDEICFAEADRLQVILSKPHEYDLDTPRIGKLRGIARLKSKLISPSEGIVSIEEPKARDGDDTDSGPKLEPDITDENSTHYIDAYSDSETSELTLLGADRSRSRFGINPNLKPEQLNEHIRLSFFENAPNGQPYDPTPLFSAIKRALSDQEEFDGF